VRWSTEIDGAISASSGARKPGSSFRSAWGGSGIEPEISADGRLAVSSL